MINKPLEDALPLGDPSRSGEDLGADHILLVFSLSFVRGVFGEGVGVR